MAVIGPPTDWVGVIGPMVPDILKVVIASWEDMPATAADEKEDRITETLCRKIRQHRTSRDLPFQVHTQFVELEPGNDENLGRLDIVFIPLVNREDIYFCLECKRLNVVKDSKTRSYASEYVSFGMLRFVTGQYSKAVRHGGMTAYVLDGDIATAMTMVEGNIQRQCSALQMTPPGSFMPSTILKGHDRARETHHQRAHESRPFCIHHLFMGSRLPLSKE